MSPKLAVRSREDAAVEAVLAGGGEMGRLARAFDWASTPLGPVSGWPQSLRTAVGILLNTRHPMFMWWGPDLIQFYNDGYRPSLGPDRHPSALGQRGRECWAEIWDFIGPQIEAVMERGEATWHEDHLVPITRGSQVYDVYWSYSYSPIPLESGGIGGVLVTVQETTKRVIADRRLGILRDLAAHETAARSEQEACDMAMAVLARHPSDLPYAMLYLREPGSQRLELRGVVGTASGRAAPARALPPDHGANPWPTERVVCGAGPLVIDDPSTPPGPNPPQAMILPLQGAGPGSLAEGVLISGLNPRLALDVSYQEFLTALATQIVRALASARAYEAASGRAEALHLELSRFASLFEQAPGFLAVLRGPDHVFELTNPAFLQLVGHRQLLGKPLREAMPEIEGQGFIALLDGVYRTGESFVGNELPMYLQRTPGAPPEEHYFNFLYQAMRDADGHISGVLTLGYDVSEQVRSRAQSERLAAERDAERRQLLTVLAQSPLAIVIVEAPSGRLLYANPKVSAVMGQDVVADRIESYNARYEGYHADGRPIAAREWPIARAIDGEVVEHETLAVVHPDGRRVDITVNAAPVRDAAGNIIAAVAMLWDVTVERRREQQLRDAQRLQAVGTLAGGVAHEINNQMTVVLGFCRFALQALGADHPQAEELRAALQAANRAAGVTHQLLAFTRMQVTQPRDVGLHDLVSGLAPVLKQLLGADKHLEIVPTRSTRLVHADPSQIEQLLINLIANARDATSTGDRVTITTEDVFEAGAPAKGRGFVIPSGDYVLLTVADTGRGMDAQTLARVFEPFYTTKSVGEGTGLGLSMVYGTVKQHGGYIEAESLPGAGATFRIYWPAAVRGQPATGPAAAEPGKSSGGSATARVLVVEDEPEVRAIVVKALAQQGYSVLEAADGAAALELVRNGAEIDVAVTDVIMPRLNGRQLHDALANLRPDLPVLFMSGYAAQATMLRELVPAGSAFLQKPFTPDDLCHTVAALLRRR